LHGGHVVKGVRLAVAGHRNPVRIDPVGEPRLTDEFAAVVRAFLLDRL